MVPNEQQYIHLLVHIILHCMINLFERVCMCISDLITIKSYNIIILEFLRL